MRTLITRLAVCLALVAVAAPTPAHATVMVELTRADLLDRSDLVVRAMVASRESRWNDDHTQVLTFTRLRITSFVKGAGSTEVTLRQIGGTVDHVVSRIAGDPQLVVGQDVIAFLRMQGDVAVFTALGQGLFVVAQGPDTAPVAVRDLSGISFVHRVAGRLVPVPREAERPVLLSDLLGDLASLRRSGR